MNKYVEMIAQKQTQTESELVLLALPDEAVMSRVVATQHGHGGVTIYSYKGKPFLEIHPPEIENVREDKSFKIKVSQKYRILR